MSDGPERQYLDDVPREIQDFLYAGQKIQAIKAAREKMGWGLKDAKERIDAVQARMREAFPAAMPAAQSAGCGTAVLVLSVVVWFVLRGVAG